LHDRQSVGIAARMDDRLLGRIADALERLAPPSAALATADAVGWHWDGARLAPVSHFAPTPLALLTGIDGQKRILVDNLERLARGFAAHDMLLWGTRGAGKSALVKAVVADLHARDMVVRLVEASADHLASLPALFDTLDRWASPVLVFVDDLAFEGDAAPARLLRSVLEGGANARPGRVRIAVTSNRRHIVDRRMGEQNDPLNPRDVVEDRLALADRFGLSIGFHACSQDDYLAMVAGYAAHLGVAFDRQDALTWSTQRGARSGRIAWHYANELAGRAGKKLDFVTI
jgi:uncharacterized protein